MNVFQFRKLLLFLIPELLHIQSIVFLQLIEMPYHYETHLQLIETLRKCGELEKLRSARKEMANKFPLTQVQRFF